MVILAFPSNRAYAQAEVRFDAFAGPLFALSGDGLAPVLPHAGLSAGAGAELRSGFWIPIRLEIGYFHVFPSSISPAGDLYRSWAGWELSLAAGVRALEKGGGLPFALDFLGGASFGADRYPGTTVAFASFSLDVLARAGFANPGRGGFRVLLPLSYVFRPGARSFSAGLCAGWEFAPPKGRGAGKSGAGKEEP